MAYRNIKKHVMKKRKHIRVVKSSYEIIRKIRIMRNIGSKRTSALRPINIMDHNIPSSYHGAFKMLITVIRAWKVPKQRTSIDRLVNEKINLGVCNTWVK